MIDAALGILRDRLNAFLSARFGVSEDLVALAPLSDAEGSPTAETRNRLAMFVTNIAEDGMPRSGGRGAGAAPQAIHMDIYFMLAAGHDPEIYGEGLKLISAALLYFQANPLLTPQTAPDLPAGINQLSVEIANLRMEEVGQLWGNMGGRYVPSVMFKMRSVMIDALSVTQIVPLVVDPQAGLLPERGR
jgi:hypothetical protein